MIKVVLDVFGGDYAPVETVKGAVLALEENKELELVLTGDENKILEVLKTLKYDQSRISIINAPEVVTNDDVPTSAIRTKTNSSLVKALETLKEQEDVVGLVSAGSTGAVLTGAFMKLGRIKGISRPALCPILPTAKGGVVAIMDCGANMDSKPINLVHFAIMANAYIKSNYGIENPRIALLSVGVEDHKGNELVKQTFPLLKQVKGINFVGNMEARELLSGDYDIVITDGFAGNVLLKSTEGAIANLLSMLKSDIKSSAMSTVGAMFMKGTFKRLKGTLDYSKHGGAVFLGCKKLIVKSHGNSKAQSIKASIFQVVEMYKANVTKVIEEEVSKIDLSEIVTE